MSNTIFRIETESGRGMYTDDDFDEVLESNGFDSDYLVRHPPPRKDPFLKWDDIHDQWAWFFGFADAEQLRRWTIDDYIREDLHERNFVVRQYEVNSPDKIRLGEFQSIFVKAGAVPIKEFHVIDFNDEEF